MRDAPCRMFDGPVFRDGHGIRQEREPSWTMADGQGIKITMPWQPSGAPNPTPHLTHLIRSVETSIPKGVLNLTVRTSYEMTFVP